MPDESAPPAEIIPRQEVDCESCGQATAVKTLRVRDTYDKRLCAGCAASYEVSFGDAVREV